MPTCSVRVVHTRFGIMDLTSVNSATPIAESSSRQVSENIEAPQGAAPDSAVPPDSRRQRRKQRTDPMIKRVFGAGKLIRHRSVFHSRALATAARVPPPSRPSRAAPPRPHVGAGAAPRSLSLIHISEPTRPY